MVLRRFTALCPLLVLPLAACSDKDAAANYDEATLAAYVAALPEEQEVTSQVPGADRSPSAIYRDGTAELSDLVIDAAINVNRPVHAIVGTLRLIVAQPPTLWDEKKREFLWGPWPSDDGVGEVLAHIRENEAGAEFRYSYAFARTVDGNLDSAVPVILGGANPGASDDRGTGVTLWDVDAHRTFLEDHDPEFVAADHPEAGRFVMAYGAADEGNSKVAFNVAVFRNFVPEEGGKPFDLDYYYGHVSGPEHQVDFLDWNMEADLCDPGTPETCFDDKSDAVTQAETMDLTGLFLDEGLGRVDVQVQNGDLTTPVVAHECWNDVGDRVAFGYAASGGTVDVGACIPPTTATVEELGVPTLEDVDPTILAKMSCIAESGLDACD